MDIMDRELEHSRNYKIFKSNEIIRKSKYDLSKEEFKLLSFIISRVKPTDTEFTTYTLSLKEYCKVIGISTNYYENYEYIKKTAKKLRDRSFWLTDEAGNDVLFSWLTRVKIIRGQGKIEFELSKDLQKHILGLIGDYTQITLLSILPMSSVYSMRLYELLKSYAYTTKAEFELEDLKKKLFAPYETFKDFRVRVLEHSIKEINLYTDIEVSYERKKQGKKVVGLLFHIKQRDTWGEFMGLTRAKEIVEGQMTIDQLLEMEKSE